MKKYVFSDQCMPSSLYSVVTRLKKDEQLIVSIDASKPITPEHIQRIEDIAKFMHEKQQSVQFVVYDASGNRTLKEAVPYTCNEQQLQSCEEINTKIVPYGHPQLGFSAYTPKFYWPYTFVVEANKLIEDIVQQIQALHLTPFETMLFIHQTLASMKNQYAEKPIVQINPPEYLRSLVSYYNDRGFVCVSYAHWTKAIIDALHMPELSCTIELLEQYDSQTDTFSSAHALNKITIQDSVYGIQGEYMNDAFWSAVNGFIGFDVSTCLYPVKDLYNIHLSGDGDTLLHNFSNYTYSQCITNKDVDIRLEEIGDYVQNKKSAPIPIVAYVKGAREILKKAETFTTEERVEFCKNLIHNSTLSAGFIFGPNATNAFSQRYKIKYNNVKLR